MDPNLLAGLVVLGLVLVVAALAIIMMRRNKNKTRFIGHDFDNNSKVYVKWLRVTDGIATWKGSGFTGLAIPVHEKLGSGNDTFHVDLRTGEVFKIGRDRKPLDIDGHSFYKTRNADTINKLVRGKDTVWSFLQPFVPLLIFVILVLMVAVLVIVWKLYKADQGGA